MHTYELLARHKGFTVEVLTLTVTPDLSYILFARCGFGETKGGEKQLL